MAFDAGAATACVLVFGAASGMMPLERVTVVVEDGGWPGARARRDRAALSQIQLAFSKDADIYVMASTGGAQTPLVMGSPSDYQPRWSADGSRILFRRDEAATVGSDS